MEEVEREEDEELAMLREEHAMAQFYLKEVNRFLYDHHEYLESRERPDKDPGFVLRVLYNKNPELQSEEEREMTAKIKRLFQIYQDAVDLERHNEEAWELGSKEMGEMPYWVARHPVLHKRAVEVHKMLHEHSMQFSESIFFPQTPEDFRENLIEDTLEEMEGRGIEEITKDYDKELKKRQALGEVSELGERGGNEEYVKKTRLLGEVLNRISDQIQAEHEGQAATRRIPSERRRGGPLTQRGGDKAADSRRQ